MDKIDPLSPFPPAHGRPDPIRRLVAPGSKDFDKSYVPTEFDNFDGDDSEDDNGESRATEDVDSAQQMATAKSRRADELSQHATVDVPAQYAEPGNDSLHGAGSLPISVPVPASVQFIISNPPAAPTLLTGNGTKSPTVMTGDQFTGLGRSNPPRQLVPGLFSSRGLSLLVGLPRRAKTLLLMYWAVAARDGLHSILGLPAAKARFLFVLLEHDQHPAQVAMAQFQTALGVDCLDHIFVTRALVLDDDESLAALSKLADSLQVDVIIIDSLRRATRSDENSSQSVSEVMRRLQSLTNENSRLVICVHHAGRGGLSPRGSVDFEAGSDTLITITRPEKGKIHTLTAFTRTSGAVEIQFRFQATETALEIVRVEQSAEDQAETGEELSLEAAVLEAVGAGCRTTRAIRQAVRAAVAGAGNEAIDETVRTLSRARRILNTGSESKHSWIVADPDLAVPDAP